MLRGEQDFEWLAGLMAEMDGRVGVRTFDAGMFASSLEQRITGCLDQIRVEQSLRTVIVAPPEAVTVAQPPAPAAETA